MTPFASQFPVVETPPFEERFRWVEGTRSGMGECVVCGQRGGKPQWDSDSHWCRAHRDHVRCTCGKAVSVRGIAMHRAANLRHGHACPPLPGQSYGGRCRSRYNSVYPCALLEGHGKRHSATVDHQTTLTWDLRSRPGHTLVTWWRAGVGQCWACECGVGGMDVRKPVKSKQQIDNHLQAVLLEESPAQGAQT